MGVQSGEDSAVRSFDDLDVFKRAYAISLCIHRASLEFPKIEQFAMADQVRRASKSICANLAEGFARQRDSSAEFRRFLTMAMGSADEMQVWLRYCRDLGYVGEKQSDGWRQEYKEIAMMLRGLRRNWR